MKRLKNCRFAAMCLAVFLLLGTALPVQAAESAPPESGTLKIVLKNASDRVDFAVYRVSDYVDGNYELTADFVGINDGITDESKKVDLNHMEEASDVIDCAANLVSWAQTQKIAPMVRQYTRDGELDLGKVELGMYLVVQVPHEEDTLNVTSFYWGYRIGRLRPVKTVQIRLH